MVKVFAFALVVAVLVGAAVVAGGAYLAVGSWVALFFNSTLGGKTLRCWVLLIASVVVIDPQSGLSRISSVMRGDRTNDWGREERRLRASAP